MKSRDLLRQDCMKHIISAKDLFDIPKKNTAFPFQKLHDGKDYTGHVSAENILN